MSEAPTSAPDAATLARLARCGWTLADWQWESCSASAAGAFAAQGVGAPASAEGWRQALQIARRDFAGDDPRLPASLTANAALLAGEGKPAAADRLLAEAEGAWDRVGFWVARMALDGPARSSIYHLRMELRHVDTYARQQRWRLLESVAQARANVARRRAAVGEAPAPPALAAWSEQAPAAFNDRRKLVAALTLIPDPVSDGTPV